MLKPSRGLLLVRPVETREHLPGSRILLTADTRERLTAWQCEVVAVGAFARCDPARSRAERKCRRAHEYELCSLCAEYPLGFGRGACCGAGRRVHPHTIRVSDWILVEPRAFIPVPEPERAEYFVHQDAVWGIFNSEPTT